MGYYLTRTGWRIMEDIDVILDNHYELTCKRQVKEKIYPSLPAHPTKDFYETVEPIERWELDCTCKPDDDDVCNSCKHYLENKYGSAIPLEGE
ncbi:MAG: hypothetical protein ACW98F_08185 [Candidatus Hodarchaeales archaeon]